MKFSLLQHIFQGLNGCLSASCAFILCSHSNKAPRGIQFELRLIFCGLSSCSIYHKNHRIGLSRAFQRRGIINGVFPNGFFRWGRGLVRFKSSALQIVAFDFSAGFDFGIVILMYVGLVVRIQVQSRKQNKQHNRNAAKDDHSLFPTFHFLLMHNTISFPNHFAYMTGIYRSRYCATASIHCLEMASSFCNPCPEWGSSKY